MVCVLQVLGLCLVRCIPKIVPVNVHNLDCQSNQLVLLQARAAEQLAAGNPGNDGYGGITHLLSYVNNTSTCIYLPDLEFFCNILKTNRAALSCFVNMTKTRILTSCNGTSPVPLISTSNPELGLSIANTTATFLPTLHLTNTTAPAIPVKLTPGFCLLGHPVGSATFANEFFTKCISIVKKCIISLNGAISDQQTKLRLFSQCINQKIPHLLSSDVLYHLPTDNPNPPWEEWNGPLTNATDKIVQSFLQTLLNVQHLPDYATLISQLGISAGGLGLLCPQLCIAPNFVLTMTLVCRHAILGFRLHKDLHPHILHPFLSTLITITSNLSSLILQRLHCLLPHIASIGCSPATPQSRCVQAFLTSNSPNNACNRIKTYCTTYLNNATHHKFCTRAPEHLHLLPSIISPHTSHLLIALCCSSPSNQLAPWIFDICIKHKLHLPIYNANTKPYCPCSCHLDSYGDHVFQCKRTCKIGAHNSITDSLPSILYHGKEPYVERRYGGLRPGWSF